MKKGNKRTSGGKLQSPESICQQRPVQFRTSVWLHLAFIIVVGIVVYSNTFQGEFVFDDLPNIVLNPAIKSWRALAHYHELLPDGVVKYQMQNRFVGFVTFALNYSLHGMQVKGYHVVNLGIHLTNALLVYFLLLALFRTPFLQHGASAGNIRCVAMPQHACALLCALLFVAHPIQTQAVTYIVQRLASLATLFYLLSLLAYIKSRIMEHAIQRYGWYAVSFCSAVLAMKTKEIAFTLPAVIMLSECMFLRGAWKARLMYLLPILLTMFIIPVGLVSISREVIGEILGDASAQNDSQKYIWVQYLLTQIDVFTTYMRLLFIPVQQNLDYDFPVNMSFFSVHTMCSFAVLISLMVAGGYLFHRSRYPEVAYRQAYRLIAFGIAFFFITLSVESSIIPLRDLIFEHRLYLPFIGFGISIVVAGVILHERIPQGTPRVLFLCAVGGIVCAYALSAYARNATWQTEVSLWSDVVAKSPAKARPHNNLGLAYERAGRIAEAAAEYEVAMKVDPGYVEAYNNLGALYERTGNIGAAFRMYVAGIAQRPDNAVLYYNLGVVQERAGNLDEAERNYRHATQLNSRFAEAYNNLGIVYLKKRQLDRAINEFRQAIAINPAFEQARKNLENAPKLFGQ